ncbi:hypothetical protein GCM10020220_062450 [Nonomuraea rubra]|uniref:LLM class flavin-dependent oxidoreductase n=1 Tax=Nonomuraea rubra TaxID=46180 RepID=UPI0031EC0CA2
MPELQGREAMTHAGFLLSCTERINVVNGIAQIWSREPRWTQSAATLLADAYPGRHLLGLGFGGDRRPGGQAVAGDGRLPGRHGRGGGRRSRAAGGGMRRLLAAYGPKMLELARDRADGAHTYHVTVRHTAQARRTLGEGPFLGVEQAVLFESDPGRARELAREHLRPYFTTPYNIAKFLRLGYTEADLDGGRGSDRLVDDLVGLGRPRHDRPQAARPPRRGRGPRRDPGAGAGRVRHAALAPARRSTSVIYNVKDLSPWRTSSRTLR